MKLDENYHIEADTYGWRLVYTKQKKKKSGKIGTHIENWYFPSLKDCLRKYVDQTLKSSPDILHVLEAIAALNKTIENICPNIYVANNTLIKTEKK